MKLKVEELHGRGNLPNAKCRTQNAERLSVSDLSCKTCAIWYEVGSVDNHGRRANSYAPINLKPAGGGGGGEAGHGVGIRL